MTEDLKLKGGQPMAVRYFKSEFIMTKIEKNDRG